MSQALVPPRFVPTLTEVVALSDQTITNASNPSNPSIASVSSVDDFHESSIASELSHSNSANSSDLRERKNQEDQKDIEDQLVRRVLQRVDVILEQRLSEAIGRIVSEQTQTLGLRLKEEIEYVVRDSVSLAFEEASQTYR